MKAILFLEGSIRFWIGDKVIDAKPVILFIYQKVITAQI
jgi:hypothetical protein